MSLFSYDQSHRRKASFLLCGVDEAGRGPLAGPVCAAAVVLPSDWTSDILTDSKKLTAKRRDQLYDEIIAIAIEYSVVMLSPKDIDTYNILQATLLAMEQAVSQLERTPDLVLIDGNQTPSLSVATKTVVKGDNTSASIAAASIIAKVTRDRYMIALDEQYPMYEFARHKGYPTKLHYETLDAYGPCPEHRESFLTKWRARRGDK